MDTQTANQLAAGAPGTVTLGGRVYLVGQPCDSDFLTLREFVRSRLKSPLEALAEHLKALPPELQQAAVREAVALQSSGASLTPDRVQAELTKPDACAFWFWLLARKEHPSLDLAEVRKAVNPDNVIAVLADLFRASSMERLEKNGRGAGGSAG